MTPFVHEEAPFHCGAQNNHPAGDATADVTVLFRDGAFGTPDSRPMTTVTAARLSVNVGAEANGGVGKCFHICPSLQTLLFLACLLALS